ncbi:MAG: complex I subunit 4 family protein [Thermogutta sp.]
MGVLLAISVFAPLAGALIIGNNQQVARRMTLGIVLLTTLISGWLAFRFPICTQQFAVFEIPWWARSDQTIGVRLSLGLDGLSVWLYALTSLLMVTSVLVSWNAINHQAATFYRLLLVLYTGMLGVFTARDLLLFYIFFEATLIPLFFLIGIWGHEDRRHAAVKFFIFTLAGSVLTFIGLLAVVIWNAAYGTAGRITFSIPELTAGLMELRSQGLLPFSVQLWIFWALFAGFAIKVPLVPFHTWLPLAHVEAPTAGSVLLAGILLKVGGYGFLRLVLPIVPDAVQTVAPWLLMLCVVGIVYGALTAFAQRDVKRLIAYSSVSHLGFCMLGVFCLSPLGLHGGLLQMINHGLATGGLFAVVGMLYERYHTRKIEAFGGLARKLPVLAFATFVLTFSSIGLPGLNGFAGEILVLVAMFQRAWAQGGWEMILAVLATSGVVLGAWYMLTLVGRLFFGQLVEPSAEAVAQRDGEQSPKPSGEEEWMTYRISSGQHEIQDLSLREVFALAPLFVFIVWIGVQPNYFIQRMTPAIRQIEQSIAVAQRPMNGADAATTRDEVSLESVSFVFGHHSFGDDKTTSRLASTDKADANDFSVIAHD